MPVSEYDILLEMSSNASQQRKTLERVLLALDPQTLSSMIVFAELKAAEAREHELRGFVRNHPDNSYAGL